MNFYSGLSSNRKLQLIVECTMDEEKEKLIHQIGIVKYRLPLINSYVIELSETDLSRLNGIEGLKAVYQNTHITTQMNVARKTVKADIAQEKGFTGRGVTIAVIDTGIAPIDDFTVPKNRIIAFKDFVNNKTVPYDDNGHGTHVCGIAAGNGKLSNGKYCGIAPNCNIVSIKVLNNEGRGNSAEVLAGIQWMVDNAERYNIRIANLSVGTTNTSSNDPLVKAVEAAWDKGIVINIAAGNNGPNSSTITSPGISRKVITVGASDDNKTVRIWGDTLVNFSGRGPTKECIIKPDIIAPGANITSCLSPTPYIDKANKEGVKKVDEYYMQLSGTSMSTPIISGAVALLLEKHPDLCPDDVKYMLKHSSVSLNYPQNQQGWGLIDIEKLISKEASHVRK